jgi:C4-dicarboxylate-specific signal transduction histidine kinase
MERTRELIAINEELRKEISERQRTEGALQEAQSELAHVTRVTIGELAASIAHEVNQPLTAIVTNANFCLRQLARASPNLEELRETIAEIVNDGTRAGSLTRSETSSWSCSRSYCGCCRTRNSNIWAVRGRYE